MTHEEERETRRKADVAWTHFNDRVCDRIEGEYGEFTNADWQAACAMDGEIQALRARLRTHSPEEPEKWAPTAANVNALPEPIRLYVHDLETRYDPAGDIRTIAVLRETVEALMAEIKELREAGAVDPERLAQMIAHRACCGTEHDPATGKLHGCCVVCGVPWPCDYVGRHPASPTPTTDHREDDDAPTEEA